MDLYSEIQASMASLIGTVELCVVDIDNHQINEIICRDQYLDISEECSDIVDFIMRVSDKSRSSGPSEDIIVTTNRFYKVIRILNNNELRPVRFIYLVLDRTIANLVLARRKLIDIELLLEADRDGGMRRSQAIPLRYPAIADTPCFAAGKAIDSPDTEDDLPPFMREDAVLKLLGIQAG